MPRRDLEHVQDDVNQRFAHAQALFRLAWPT